MNLLDIESIKAPWAIDDKSMLSQLHADSESGLSSTEAARRLSFVGYNKIESSNRISTFRILINQFISPFVLLLTVAAGLSFFFKE